MLLINHFSPAKAPNLAELCNPITRQAIQLESCPNIHGFSKSCSQNRKKTFVVFGGVISGGDVTKKSCFGNFGHICPALGPNPLTHSFGSKFF